MESSDERNEFISSLHEEYGKMLHKQCRHYIGNDPKLMYMAEECVQEVFYKALLHYHRLSKHENIAGWLVQAARHYIANELHKYIRRSRVVSLTPDYEEYASLEDVYFSIEKWAAREECAQAIQQVLRLLSPTEKTVFQDHFLSGYSLDETAHRNGMKHSHVRAASSRIQQKIRKMSNGTFYLVYFAVLITYTK